MQWRGRRELLTLSDLYYWCGRRPPAVERLSNTTDTRLVGVGSTSNCGSIGKKKKKRAASPPPPPTRSSPSFVVQSRGCSRVGCRCRTWACHRPTAYHLRTMRLAAPPCRVMSCHVMAYQLIGLFASSPPRDLGGRPARFPYIAAENDVHETNVEGWRFVCAW